MFKKIILIILLFGCLVFSGYKGRYNFTQELKTTSSPTFVDLTLTGTLDVNGLTTATGGSTTGDVTDHLDISDAGVLSLHGDAGLQIPHMMQSDSTDQAIADTDFAQLVTFDTDVHHFGITRTSSSRFTITQQGSYLIAFSGVAIGATGQTLEVWLRQSTGGGAAVDVANTNTIYSFKTTGVSGIVAVTFLNHFMVGDYFEFWTWGSAVSSKWNATAAGTNPTRPACPSIIMTCNYIGVD